MNTDTISTDCVFARAINMAIAILGSQVALAKEIGCTPQVINNWLRRDRVPVEFCMKIERATGGRVTCEMLRPDVDWADRKYMPEAA